VERQTAAEPDFVARRAEEARAAILQAAARQFARRGYKRARIADIIRDAGVTAPVFYTHFSTKRQLFVESFNVFVHWMGDLIEPPLADEPDPAVRLLMRFYAYWGLQRLSPDLLGLARAEALQEDSETRAAVQEAQRWITAGPARDLAALRATPDDPPVSDELMAYSLFGAGEEVFMRASWDDAYSPRELLRAHLFLYLAVDAAYTGRCDTVERLRSYEPLIERLIEEGPPIPHDALP
jgi:AcrR family transcriptional regulator